jgi:hypothetical protein
VSEKELIFIYVFIFVVLHKVLYRGSSSRSKKSALVVYSMSSPRVPPLRWQMHVIS